MFSNKSASRKKQLNNIDPQRLKKTTGYPKILPAARDNTSSGTRSYFFQNISLTHNSRRTDIPEKRIAKLKRKKMLRKNADSCR